MSIIHTIYTKYIFNNIKLLLVRMIKISGRSLNIKFYLLCSEFLWHISENNIRKLIMIFENSRSSRPEVIWKHAANLQENTHTEVLCNFIEIAPRNGCSLVNLLHILRTPFPKNTSGWLLLKLGTNCLHV